MSVLTAAEVKRAAGIAGTTSDDEDAEIEDMIAAIDAVIARRCGLGAVPGAIGTWTGSTRNGALVLPWRFRSISSVSVDGVTVTPTTLYGTHRASMGILDGVSGAVPWASGSLVTVAALVGPEVCDPLVERAAFLIAQHWWQLRRQGGRGAWAQENGYPVDAPLPKAALELLPANVAGFG